jgi:hypothetical protein
MSVGSYSQLILAAPSEVFVLQSEPVVRAFSETQGSDLSVIVQLYALVGAIPRHPLAVQSVSSAAYLASPTFA